MAIKKEKVRKVNREKASTQSVKKPFPTEGEYKFVPAGLSPFCIAIDQVRLLDKNPRINDDASKKLAELIKENGFRKPIVIDQDGIVRAGNTAYKAARLLGMKFIPVAQSEFAGEADAMRFVISDNKASEFSYWDTELLRELVTSEKLDAKENLAGLGFTDAELAKLFEIQKEKQLKHLMEVVVSVETEQEAKELFDSLTDSGYKCRVLAL